MAYEIPGFSFTLPSGADFTSGAQFRFCDVSNTGKAVNPTAGSSVVGVRQNRPKLNEGATIIHSGISFVEAGGVVAAGDLIAADATGRALKATTGQTVVGRALEAASAAGIQIAVLLNPNTAAAA